MCKGEATKVASRMVINATEVATGYEGVSARTKRMWALVGW